LSNLDGVDATRRVTRDDPIAGEAAAGGDEPDSLASPSGCSVGEPCCWG
jgi:hypothetical protein